MRRRLARAVNRVARRRVRMLDDRYHVHLPKTPTEVRNALRYVLLNAHRHSAAVRSAAARVAEALRVRLDPADVPG